MLISIIITSYQEEQTIYKAIGQIFSAEFKKIYPNYQFITVIPDQPTIDAAKKAVKDFKIKNWQNIVDPLRGKPFALNMALQKAKGEIILLTDGDAYFDDLASVKLLSHFTSNNIGGVTGRPVSQDPINNFFGYTSHLLSDAAHHKRMVSMTDNVAGKSIKFISKVPGFFVLSGYILAMRKLDYKLPNDCLIEDAYFSYFLQNLGLKLIYEPEAKVYVKYPQNLKDWYKQKLRSVGGYIQLWKYGIVNERTKVRNFWKELEYAWFPIKYAKNFKQLIWSLALYPLRLLLWMRIYWEQKILKKDLIGTNGWERIESTK